MTYTLLSSVCLALIRQLSVQRNFHSFSFFSSSACANRRLLSGVRCSFTKILLSSDFGKFRAVVVMRAFLALRRKSVFFVREQNLAIMFVSFFAGTRCTTSTSAGVTVQPTASPIFSSILEQSSPCVQGIPFISMLLNDCTAQILLTA